MGCSADVVGAQRQFAVTAVDEHRELHRCRAAEVAQRVEGGADGAPRIEDVIDKDDDRAVDTAGGHHGALERPVRFVAQIVAVQGDVEIADRNIGTGELRIWRPAVSRETFRGWGCR